MMVASAGCPGVALAQEKADAEASQCQLELTISDSQTQKPVSARVRVRDASGADHAPAGALEIPVGPDRWFVADGTARLAIPHGRTSIRVERGTEYAPVMETMDAGAGPVIQHSVTLKRWIDMRKLGYASGEDHLHVKPEDLGAMLASEDLDFGTSLTWWNGPKFKLPADAKADGEVLFDGARFPASLFDAEVEDKWGAVYLIGLKHPLTIKANRRRAHLAYAREAHEQGALVCYQGGWSREALLDALLGYVDAVNLLDNSFQRHRYQPRGLSSNLLEVEGLPTYPDSPEGMMLMNLETYYRLLNCGLRLAAGAGSATGAKANPAGYDRSYARYTGTNTADFLEAWKKGRNFVTDGPMVFLSVNDTNAPGDTVPLPGGGGVLRVEARATCNEPLRSLEIIVNGEIAGKATLSQDERGAKVVVTVNARAGSWIAARATAEDRLLSDADLALYVKPDPNSQKPCRLLFGHTSPVYVTVGGAGAAVEKSLAEASRMLDGFEHFASSMAAEAYRAEVLEAIPIARKRLAGLGGRQQH